jgi:cell division protein FtsQ
MDGQRRIARPLSGLIARNGDIIKSLRFSARFLAVGFVGFALLHGILQGGHLVYPGSPYMKLPGKIAGFMGQAADDIAITGVEQHDPKSLLPMINVKPGGSLVGFDAARARRVLETLDWVQQANVRRIFPNRLEIEIVEREAYVIWQNEGVFQLVDRTGKVMGKVTSVVDAGLPVVTGRGANMDAQALINDLEAMPDLKSAVKAAARVGERRWNLYLKNGVRLALPEHSTADDLKRAWAFLQQPAFVNAAIAGLDFRVRGEVRVQVAGADPITTAGTAPAAP